MHLFSYWDNEITLDMITVEKGEILVPWVAVVIAGHRKSLLEMFVGFQHMYNIVHQIPYCQLFNTRTSIDKDIITLFCTRNKCIFGLYIE